MKCQGCCYAQAAHPLWRLLSKQHARAFALVRARALRHVRRHAFRVACAFINVPRACQEEWLSVERLLESLTASAPGRDDRGAACAIDRQANWSHVRAS